MREIENLAQEMPSVFKNTLLEAKRTIKLPCEHGGGCIDVDKCMEAFIGKRNENKVFVGTNDEELRNRIRDKGIAPIFFYDKKSGILIMDKPSDVVNQKLQIKEQLKMEPTHYEKKMLRAQAEAIYTDQKEERQEAYDRERGHIKDMLCLGLTSKPAKGPNPLAVLKKRTHTQEAKEVLGEKRKRRPRKGKRDRELSQAKKRLCIRDEETQSG
jgi:hypothetical protein